MTRKITAYAMTVLVGTALAGCAGDAGQSFDQNVPAPPRVNTLKVLDDTPDLAVNGDTATLVAATPLDSNGAPIAAPSEQPYSGTVVFTGLPIETRKVELNYQRAQGFSLSKRVKEADFSADADGEIEVQEQSAPLLGAAPPSRFTVRLVNTSDYPDEQVFVAVNGKNKAKTAFYYLQFGANNSNSFQPFQGTAQSDLYSQQLTQLHKEAAPHTYSFQCPYEDLVSGRIYLSFGKKLKGIGLNNINKPLDLQLPSPSGFPDAQTLFEFMELSATIPDDLNAPQVYTLFANTSVVDFFSMGLGMTLNYQNNGHPTSETVGFVDGARQKVLDQFAAGTTPSEFRRYVLKDGSQTILRVLAPVQGVAIDPTGPLSQFLQSAIDSGWTKYTGTTLNIPDTLAPTLGYKWTGLPVASNILTMTCTAKPTGDTATGSLESLGEVCALPKPTSRIVFFCDDDAAFNPNVTPVRNTFRNDGSQGHKRLVSLLSSALNRGVFEDYSKWNQSAQFYTRADGRYNHFAKIMHQFALNGKVYGFGYDDVYGQDPTLARTLSDVNQVIITIPKVPVL